MSYVEDIFDGGFRKEAIGLRDLAVPAAGLALMAPGMGLAEQAQAAPQAPNAITQTQGASKCVLPAAAAALSPGERVPSLEAKLPVTSQGAYQVIGTGDPTRNYVTLGNPTIYLSTEVVKLLTTGKPGDTDAARGITWTTAVYVLYHEWWHLAFSEPNEKNTDLGSISIIRDMLRQHWGLSATQAQQIYQELAGMPGISGEMNTSYHPEYTPNDWDPLLPGGPPPLPKGPGPDAAGGGKGTIVSPDAAPGGWSQIK